jgi:hypothetical protein
MFLNTSRTTLLGLSDSGWSSILFSESDMEMSSCLDSVHPFSDFTYFRHVFVISNHAPHSKLVQLDENFDLGDRENTISFHLLRLPQIPHYHIEGIDRPSQTGSIIIAIIRRVPASS